MKGIFNIESKFGHMLMQFSQLILLSLYWLLFSAPVFTWGAASSALYTCCRKMLHEDETKMFGAFFKAFKQNFKQGCIMGIATMLFLLLVIYCLLLAMGMDVFDGTVGTIGGIIYVLIIVAVLVYLHYVFSYIARFEDNLKTVLRNCVYLCLSHFDTSLRLAFQFGIIAAAFYFLQLIRYLPLIILLLPAGYSLVTVDPLEKVFKQYLPKDEDEDEEVSDEN